MIHLVLGQPVTPSLLGALAVALVTLLCGAVLFLSREREYAVRL